MVFHTLAQGSLGFGKNGGHEEESWPYVEAVPAQIERGAASAWHGILLEQGNAIPGICQPGSRRQPADPGADYDDLCRTQGRISSCLCSML
jgi:hypothetical protein